MAVPFDRLFDHPFDHPLSCPFPKSLAPHFRRSPPLASCLSDLPRRLPHPTGRLPSFPCPTSQTLGGLHGNNAERLEKRLLKRMPDLDAEHGGAGGAAEEEDQEEVVVEEDGDA